MAGTISDNKGNVLVGTDNGDGTWSIAGGGGGGGGAVTVANGANVVEGSTTDAAVSTDSNGTINAHIRGIVKLLAAGITVAQRALASGTDSVTTVPSGTQTISGTVTANAGSGTLAVSSASLPLPTGASTAANQATEITSLSTIASGTPALGQAAMAASSPVVIASNQTAVPVSNASLPLPTGAATSAKQPALGTAGTASADVISVQGEAAMTPLLCEITDGTTIASNVAGDAGQNSQVVTGARKEVSFTTTTAQAVASTDCSNYRWATVHIVTQGTTSTITFQGSNDNTNWVSIALLRTDGVGLNAPAQSSTTAGIGYAGPINFRYFRLNVTGITAGTTAGVIEFFSVPPAVLFPAAMSAQNGAWTVQPGNTPNTTPWLVQQTAAAAGGYLFSHLAANATTTIKSGAGTLHTVVVNSAGTADTITLYDNTAGSGTVIAIIDSALSTGRVYDLAFATGLTAVIAGTTAPDITVTYK